MFFTIKMLGTSNFYVSWFRNFLKWIVNIKKMFWINVSKVFHSFFLVLITTTSRLYIHLLWGRWWENDVRKSFFTQGWSKPFRIGRNTHTNTPTHTSCRDCNTSWLREGLKHTPTPPHNHPAYPHPHTQNTKQKQKHRQTKKENKEKNWNVTSLCGYGSMVSGMFLNMTYLTSKICVCCEDKIFAAQDVELVRNTKDHISISWIYH